MDFLPQVRVFVRVRREGVFCMGGKVGDVLCVWEVWVGECERLSIAVGVVMPLFGAVDAAEEEVEERFVRVKRPILYV